MIRNTLYCSVFAGLLAVAADGLAAFSLRAVRPTDGPAARGALAVRPAQTTFASEFDRARADNELRTALRVVADRDGAGPQTAQADRAAQPAADDAAAISELRDLVTQTGATPATLAKALGVRPGVVNLLLSSPEKIPAEHRSALFSRARETLAGELAGKSAWATGHVPTAVTRMVAGVVRTAMTTQTCALIVGSAGLGKSCGVRAAAAQLAGRAIVCRCGPDTRGWRGLLHAIGAAAGQPAWAVRPSLKAGVELVKNADALILDEAQALTEPSFETARALHDSGGVPVVFIGTRMLTKTLSPAADPWCGPLASRVSVVIDLDAELRSAGRSGRWLSAEELRAILAASKIDAAFDGGAVSVLTQAANERPGHVRAALNAARVAAVLAGDSKGSRVTIDGDLVRSALAAAGGISG